MSLKSKLAGVRAKFGTNTRRRSGREEEWGFQLLGTKMIGSTEEEVRNPLRRLARR